MLRVSVFRVKRFVGANRIFAVNFADEKARSQKLREAFASANDAESLHADGF